MIQVDGIFVQQGGGGPVFPEFTYTGDYHIVNEGTPDWKIYFTSSGTFTPASNIAVQVQAIGGGSGGNSGNAKNPRVGGGGGNSMVNEIILEAGIEYPLTIGAGGTGGAYRGAGASGGTTTGFGLTAAGGVAETPVDVFEFNDTSGIRQSGTGGSGGSNSAGTAGENAGDIDPNVGGGYGGPNGKAGGNGNFGSVGGKPGVNNLGGGGGGGGGYGGGGGGGGTSSQGTAGDGGAGAPGVVIMRNTRLAA